MENDKNSKIRMVTPPNNIGVNPAWNLGVKESKFDKICLLSDDVLFDVNVFNFLYDKLEEKDGLVGMAYPAFPQEGSIKALYVQKLHHGFGAAMFFNKLNYVPIPDEFKIFFGDIILFVESIRRGKTPRIVCPTFSMTEMSTTSGLPEFARQTQTEVDLWMKLVGIESSNFFQ
jgi:hypothetical protein